MPENQEYQIIYNNECIIIQIVYFGNCIYIYVGNKVKLFEDLTLSTIKSSSHLYGENPTDEIAEELSKISNKCVLCSYNFYFNDDHDMDRFYYVKDHLVKDFIKMYKIENANV